jgi:hypothetical protein
MIDTHDKVQGENYFQPQTMQLPNNNRATDRNGQTYIPNKKVRYCKPLNVCVT